MFFFFFIGGVDQQVRQVLKSGVGRCINCGSRADLVDYDTVLKVFFVPVWRWPGKEPLLHCDSCNLFFPQSVSLPPPHEAVADAIRCQSCERPLEADYRFCPYCGVAL
uniref:Zinc-ribbon 15 domain-containing protein n=1 Tax=Opuntia streptacantha TaxID=393608 RepID=A0A7C8ZHH3_OPUST